MASRSANGRRGRRRAARPKKFATGCGNGALRRRSDCVPRSVNESLTAPSHSYAWMGSVFVAFAAPGGGFMRCVIAAMAAAATVLVGAASASAEKRVFIIANNPDGYGVDRCLAAGEACGTTVANSYCRRASSRRPCRSARSTATTSPAPFPRAAPAPATAAPAKTSSPSSAHAEPDASGEIASYSLLRHAPFRVRFQLRPDSARSTLKRPPPVTNSSSKPPATARFLVRKIY